MKFDLDALCEELSLQEIAELCPDDAHREKLIVWTLQLYASDLGFSDQLKAFIESKGIPIGSALTKGSPIQLQKQPQIQKEKSVAKEPEVTPNMTLAGALVFVVPELVEVLERDNTATLSWDGETLALGDAKPKKAKKEEPKEEAKGKGKPEPKKEEPKKGSKKEEPEEEETMTEEEFNEMLEGDLQENDALAEFAESMEIAWEKHKNEKINRMRIVKAIRKACGWSE